VTFGVTGVLATATSCSILYLVALWIQRMPYYYEDAINIALLFFVGLVAAQLVAKYLSAVESQETLRILNLKLEERVANAVAAERATHQKLLDAQRLTMLGEAAAHIAHEIKNPLVSIGGFASRIRRQIPKEHVAQEGLTIITREVARLEAMLSELLDFASPSHWTLRPIDVVALMQNVLQLAQPLVQEQSVQLEFVHPGQTLSILGNLESIKRAIFNIVLNGVQAMSAGGKLSVEVVSSSKDDGRGVEITVHDTGPGIPLDVMPRIFEPFFTTKQEGTGLGLALAKKTVDTHGGSVYVESSLNMGTSITIWFPSLAATVPQVD
jgi:two-component system, NtrC family, sensor histidine kinase HydH